MKTLLVTERQYLKDFPTDPIKSSKLHINSAFNTNDYGYIRLKRNNNANTAYMLVTRVETADKANATSEMIKNFTHNSKQFGDFQPCKEVSIKPSEDITAVWPTDDSTACSVKKADELIYVMIR